MKVILVLIVLLVTAISVQAITIETVPVGRQGNAADMRYTDLAHPSGVGAVKCDGSAEFVSSDVDLTVWRSQSTIAGDDPPLYEVDPEGNGQ